jgi:hypothetical protein
MKKERHIVERVQQQVRRQYRVRLPGFVDEADIGLGQMVKTATSYFGIKSCGGCARRAAYLDTWLVFSGRRK